MAGSLSPFATSTLPDGQTLVYLRSTDTTPAIPTTYTITQTLSSPTSSPTESALLTSTTTPTIAPTIPPTINPITSSSSTSVSTSSPTEPPRPSESTTQSSVIPSIINGTTTTASSSASTPSPTMIPPPPKSSSNTGYIAAIAVLAALLGIALAVVAFLWFRKKRGFKQTESLGSVTYEPKGHSEPTQVAALERQLRERDDQLRASQAALLQQGRSVGGDALDDRQVSQRFAQVNKSIRDWVVGNFKNISGNPTITRDVAPLLQGTQPNYRAMLEDPRKKYLVLRSLVAEVLVQAFKSRELVGSVAYSELDSWVKESGTGHDVSEWRAMTMTLLEKSSAYRSERASSLQEISKRIDRMAAEIAGLGYSEQRSTQMHKIVDGVALLVLDLMRQKSTYDLVMERGAFESVSMEDALQDHGEERLHGRHVQCVVFPAVRKWEDGVEKGGNRGRVLSKAQVVI